MENLSLSIDKVFDFVPHKVIYALKDEIETYNRALRERTDKGNDFLGWVHLPSQTTPEVIQEIQDAADVLKKKSEIVIVIGIGGSYLGAKATIEALSDNFALLKERKAPHVLFAGNNIGEDYLVELRELLQNKEYSLIVISKSGTTTEPAIAFRILKNDLEQKYGKQEASKRIIAVTDAKKGALRKLADKEGYKTFVIPDNIGGRYSVLTPVGLVPIAVAGFDIAKIIAGARKMEELTSSDVPFEENPAAIYAAARNMLYRYGKHLEVLVNYNQKLNYVSEWWKQLYGESEGKQNRGIFPASVNFTADLHSMGQYIQEGRRNLFEVVLSIDNVDNELTIPKAETDLDDLNYLAGKRLDYVNKMAELGTLLAHIDGGVPNINIRIPRLDEYYLGQLYYFFERACGISGYALRINPFDQPGVEAYKKNMFALLGKPGFEEETKKIRERLNDKA